MTTEHFEDQCSLWTSHLFFREKPSVWLLLYDLYEENSNFKDGGHLDSSQLVINLVLFIEARTGVSK